jgi:hypothetical protein
MEFRNAIVGARNTTGHAQGWLFGYNERYLKMELGTCDADISNDRPADENAPTKMQEYGPFRFPDPNPSGYGGPKSTTPAPKPVATAARVTPAVTRPAPLPVAAGGTGVGGRLLNVAWARAVS